MSSEVRLSGLVLLYEYSMAISPEVGNYRAPVTTARQGAALKAATDNDATRGFLAAHADAAAVVSRLPGRFTIGARFRC